jgi:hypothetical protein
MTISGRTMRFSKYCNGAWRATAVLVLVGLPAVADAQLADRDTAELERLRSIHGRSQEEIAPLLAIVREAGARGLPQELLANKVKEGLAKGIEPARIERVVRAMATRLEAAHGLLTELSITADMRDPRSRRSLQVLSDVLGRRVSADDVRAIDRIARQGGRPLDAERLAYGARLLAMLKDTGVDGTRLVGEGLRQGYRPGELIHLGRELRHNRELSANPARLEQLQRDIEGGRRMDDVLQELRQDRREAGLPDRPERSRPRRFGRSERLQRPNTGELHDPPADRPIEAETP